MVSLFHAICLSNHRHEEKHTDEIQDHNLSNTFTRILQEKPEYILILLVPLPEIVVGICGEDLTFSGSHST